MVIILDVDTRKFFPQGRCDVPLPKVIRDEIADDTANFPRVTGRLEI